MCSLLKKEALSVSIITLYTYFYMFMMIEITVCIMRSSELHLPIWTSALIRRTDCRTGRSHVKFSIVQRGGQNKLYKSDKAGIHFTFICRSLQ